MARPTKRRREQQRKAKRLATRDQRVEQELAEPVLAELDDWQLARCDACGLVQSTSAVCEQPCLVCGCPTGTYGASIEEVETLRETVRRRLA